jgi:hypothetical protein
MRKRQASLCSSPTRLALPVLPAQSRSKTEPLIPPAPRAGRMSPQAGMPPKAD